MNGRLRGDVQREREREERRVAEISLNLESYKREIQNFQTAAREMRVEEERLERLYDAFMEAGGETRRVCRGRGFETREGSWTSLISLFVIILNRTFHLEELGCYGGDE